MEDSFLADCTYPVSPPAALPGATTIQTFSPNSLLHLTSPRNRETFLRSCSVQSSPCASVCTSELCLSEH